MRKATKQFRSRMAKRHACERRAKSRREAAKVFMSWQNRVQTPKKRTPQRRAILRQRESFVTMAAIMAGVMR